MIVAISLLAIKNLWKIDSLMSSSISQNGSIASELTYVQSKNIFNWVTLLWKETTKTTNSWETCNVLGRKVWDTAWKNYTAKNIKNQIPMNIAPQGVVIPDTNYPSTTDAPPTTEDENNKTRTQHIYLSWFYTGTYEFKISCTEGESNTETISFEETRCNLVMPTHHAPDLRVCSIKTEISKNTLLWSSAVAADNSDPILDEAKKLKPETQKILQAFKQLATCAQDDAIEKAYKWTFEAWLNNAERDALANKNLFAQSVIKLIRASDPELKPDKKSVIFKEAILLLNEALIKYWNKSATLNDFKIGTINNTKKIKLYWKVTKKILGDTEIDLDKVAKCTEWNLFYYPLKQPLLDMRLYQKNIDKLWTPEFAKLISGL